MSIPLLIYKNPAKACSSLKSGEKSGGDGDDGDGGAGNMEERGSRSVAR
jgi:hypothetical protein